MTMTPTVNASVLLIAFAGVQSLAAYFALKWAVSKSNRVFFSIFVGDALLRLACLGVAVALLWVNHVGFTAPLLSLAFAYLLFSLVQVPFFYRVR